MKHMPNLVSFAVFLPFVLITLTQKRVKFINAKCDGDPPIRFE
jgi:hypothetical protein